MIIPDGGRVEIAEKAAWVEGSYSRGMGGLAVAGFLRLDRARVGSGFTIV